MSTCKVCTACSSCGGQKQIPIHYFLDVDEKTANKDILESFTFEDNFLSFEGIVNNGTSRRAVFLLKKPLMRIPEHLEKFNNFKRVFPKTYVDKLELLINKLKLDKSKPVDEIVRELDKVELNSYNINRLKHLSQAYKKTWNRVIENSKKNVEWKRKFIT